MAELLKKAIRTLAQEGPAALIKKIGRKILGLTAPEAVKHSQTPEDILAGDRNSIRPLYTVDTGKKQKRLNLISDNVENGPMRGEAALALAGRLALKNNMSLRIITRKARPEMAAFGAFAAKRGLCMPETVEFYSDYDRVLNTDLLRLEVSDNDVFMADSWKGAAALAAALKNKKFFLLVSEAAQTLLADDDERFLYEETMKNSDIGFIYLSKRLYDSRLKINPGAAKHGAYFEPAFTVQPGEQSFAKKEKYRLFFAGKPGAAFGMYKTGLKYLDMAIGAGIIDPSGWEIVLAGDEIKNFNFSDKSIPLFRGLKTWSEQDEFSRSVDLAFSLNYSECPDYLAMEMAASGAVVLTNHYMENYKGPHPKNIIAVDLNDAAMLKGFKTAAEIAGNPAQRMGNFSSGKFLRSWEASIEPLYEFAEKNMNNHA